MKKISVFMNKELKRFISDKRMLLSVIMPGILIYLIYSMIGNFMFSQEVEEELYKIKVFNMPECLEFIEDVEVFEFDVVENNKIDNYIKMVKNEDVDLVIDFPKNFDAEMGNLDFEQNNSIIDVSMYYNSASTNSIKAYNTMVGILGEYEDSIFNIININNDKNVVYDLASKESNSKKLFSSLVPMLLLAFIINGCVSIASESIAGEKERGTMATMLVTPVDRRYIAIGKILGLSIIGLISGVSVFIGLIFSLPQLSKGISAEVELDISIYGVKEYVMLMIIIISSVLLFVSIFAVISALSKSVKEANMMSTPLTFLSVIVSLPTMVGGNVEEQWQWYMVPVYNSVQCMNSVMNLSIDYIHIVITVLCNLLFTFIFVGILTKMIGEEKIIFS